MRYLFSILLCLLLSAVPSLAEGPAEARELIETKIDAVMMLLQDELLRSWLMRHTLSLIAMPKSAPETSSSMMCYWQVKESQILRSIQ